MASLPPRQAAQSQRPSPEQPSSSQSRPQSSQSPVRTRSEDSQTLYLNKPEETTTTSGTAQDSQQQHEAPPQGADDDSSVKNCWICFSDSSEDTPETSPWRSPCPCSLVAHEACLLDWIADMESPSNRRRNDSLSAPKIECPQCKTEIKLARPRNLIVDAVQGSERLISQAVTPGAVFFLFGTVWHSSMLWGLKSIYDVFGAEDGNQILSPLLQNVVRAPMEFGPDTTRAEVTRWLMNVLLDRLQHWRLYAGVPLITPLLVLSRTSLADSILPVLPIVFFATQNHASHDPIEFGSWPPSAGMAFATLPYLRSAYNYYYRRVWAPKERQWLKEIQPRLTQDAANPEGGNGAQVGEGGEQGMGAREDDDNVFEVRIDGGLWEDWEDDTDDEDAAVAQQAVEAAIAQAAQNPPIHIGQDQQAPTENTDANQQLQQDQDQPPRDDQPNQAPQPAQPAQPRQPAPAAQPPAGERRLSFSPTAIAETVLGALMFPTIAGLSGELLKLCLPASLTVATYAKSSGWYGGSRRVARGILQEKWGRSLVGGCLAVVLKDAVMLYVRWKMAEMHRGRRVVDWTGDRRGRS